MNEAYEVELTQLEASFVPSRFNLVLGVERQTTLKVENADVVMGFTDVDWQVIYARAFIEDKWVFLPPSLYDEIDEQYGELIGDKLWQLTQSL